MSEVILIYSDDAEYYGQGYDAMDFEQVHSDWIDLLPEEGLVLDVGAGSGRDARYMASKGLTVWAVEPAEGLRIWGSGQRQSSSGENAASIKWIDDRLPDLTDVIKLQTKFDLILVSAVWQHVAPTSRARAIRNLASLLKPGGRIVISLRNGEFADERTGHPVSATEIARFASDLGLSFQLHDTEPIGGPRKTDPSRGVTWQTVVLTLPDDGTGASPLI